METRQKPHKMHLIKASTQVLLLAISLSFSTGWAQDLKTDQASAAPELVLLLTKEQQEWGEAAGKGFKEGFTAIKQKNISPSDQKAVEAEITQAMKNAFHEKVRTPEEWAKFEEAYKNSQLGENPEKAIANLNDTRKAYIEKIREALKTSRSYAGFVETLVGINNEIAQKVSGEDRTVLLNAICILYYTLKAMNELAGEGLLPGNSEQAPNIQIKTLE